MKAKYIAILIVLSCVCGVAQAQMLIKNNGKIIVGSNTRPYDDGDNVLSLSIQGNSGEYNAGAKLGFGDFGRRSRQGWNVFVGEYGDDDTDMLWLHGKNGIKATSSDGGVTIFQWGANEDMTTTMTFCDGVRANRLSVSCDDGHKANIEGIDAALSRLMRLQGLRYHYHSPENSTLSLDEQGSGPTDVSKKELQDMEWQAALRDVRTDGNYRYGLMASEVAEQFPELVTTDDNGIQYVNYQEMIPIMLVAIQQLAFSMEKYGFPLELKKGAYGKFSTDEVSRLDSLAQTRFSKHKTQPKNSPQEAELYQNQPNPFGSETTIEYYVPQDVGSVTLYIFTLTGKLVMSYPIDTRGYGSTVIKASSLEAGMYVYSLVTDNHIVDTKRMILTQ